MRWFRPLYIFFIFLLVGNVPIVVADNVKDGECKASMFVGPGKKAALKACNAQYAFQRNWYPDPIAGTLCT